MATIRIHIRLPNAMKAACGSASRDYVSLDGERHGTTVWAWTASDSDIAQHLCRTCNRILGAEWRKLRAEDAAATKAAWESLPERIRQAIETAHGGNRTVVRCEVPGYSSRLSRCIERLCEEHGTTKAEVGETLIAAGRTHICGLPIPLRWAGIES